MRCIVPLYLMLIVLCLLIFAGCTSAPDTHPANLSPAREQTADQIFWEQMTQNAGWSARYFQGSAALPDGSIVLTGGVDKNGIPLNDVWRSTDDGATWKQMTERAEWPARGYHTSVALSDGSIILLGGADSNGTALNDVWRSTDDGATWMQVTPRATWPARDEQSTVVLPDGSIVLIGGLDNNYSLLNDVWRSADDGATWTQMTTHAGWPVRSFPGVVAPADGSIVVMGGLGGNGVPMNDVWRSTDDGATWEQVNTSAGWSARAFQKSIALPDGSIVLLGGADGIGTALNDVWRSTDDGAIWKPVNTSAGWPARIGFGSVVLPDSSIVIMGGGANSGEENGGNDSEIFYNDVWRITSFDCTPGTIHTCSGTQVPAG